MLIRNYGIGFSAGVSCLTGAFRKIYHYLFGWVASINTKDEPHVQVFYLNRKSKVINPETAESISIAGHILEKDGKLRKVQKHGDSYFVSHPPGWLDTVSSEGVVKTCLILQENGEKAILISTPSKEDD